MTVIVRFENVATELELELLPWIVNVFEPAVRFVITVVVLAWMAPVSLLEPCSRMTARSSLAACVLAAADGEAQVGVRGRFFGIDETGDDHHRLGAGGQGDRRVGATGRSRVAGAFGGWRAVLLVADRRECRGRPGRCRPSGPGNRCAPVIALRRPVSPLRDPCGPSGAALPMTPSLPSLPAGPCGPSAVSPFGPCSPFGTGGAFGTDVAGLALGALLDPAGPSFALAAAPVSPWMPCSPSGPIREMPSLQSSASFGPKMSWVVVSM